MVGPVEVATASQPSCVALTQEHRGHGVSTATYYLGRALVEQGLHVLVGNLSQRSSELEALTTHDPLKNLVPWVPPPVAPADLGRLLKGARQRTAGLADVLLLDMDIALLEDAGRFGAEIDYIVVFVEHTSVGESEAERLAKHLGNGTTPPGRVGVVFSRVDAPSAEDLPRRLESGVPVLSWLPADYLLAAGEAYSLKGGNPARPHDAYLSQVARLAQSLARLVPLQRHQADANRVRTG